ncbi:M15 family metallopeptidase [Cellulosimicrobium sp. Marseille-Q4280]|uniref:M15 family metallopeptidase n=1 Tax=Cellulosimicrobium sp. Marseille-Q4280 TaxID=2937992 RepID=UPI00203A69BF|nr:M15 family metallopeptidase [Cellulosimicrobium sp. Marseille-Q4280]
MRIHPTTARRAALSAVAAVALLLPAAGQAAASELPDAFTKASTPSLFDLSATASLLPSPVAAADLRPEHDAPSRSARSTPVAPYGPLVPAAPPAPQLSHETTGRTVTITGRHWAPGAVVTATNISQAASGPGDASADPWPGQANGLADGSILCASEAAGGRSLRCDAAGAFDAMMTAMTAATGASITLNDAYRSLGEQVHLRATLGPRLAAVPGTSNHGFGTAIDIANQAAVPGTITGDWLAANAGAYGWVHPAWARPGGTKPEHWHWEFAGFPGGTTTSTTVAADGTFTLVVSDLLGAPNEIVVDGWAEHLVVTGA